nr:reverse transcriptase domain-containing protein [Tanacetum cinerariifolium]
VQVVRHGAKVARNANNNKKWESGHGGNSGKQQNKKRKVVRAHIVRSGNKNGYAGKSPLCNRKQGHYKSECSKLKNQNFSNQKGNEGKARRDPNVIADNANA